eukprot:11643179-Karenia_brevis.AAC.1
MWEAGVFTYKIFGTMGSIPALVGTLPHPSFRPLPLANYPFHTPEARSQTFQLPLTNSSAPASSCPLPPRSPCNLPFGQPRSVSWLSLQPCPSISHAGHTVPAFALATHLPPLGRTVSPTTTTN